MARESKARPGVLLQADLERVKAAFGVSDEQVVRDHAISHLLAAISAMDGAQALTFIGGTALSRTFLPGLRLSEDIDLMTSSTRQATADALQGAINRGLRRTHGAVSWQPELARTKGSESAVVRVGDRVLIRIQLLAERDYPRWPTTRRPLEQRYTDAPEATLTTLTPSGFAASKTATWLERRASRDLYDLWGLAQEGHINAETSRLFTTLGPTGTPVAEWMFKEAPGDVEWQAALGHQGNVRVGPAEALSSVRSAWRAAVKADAGRA